MAETIDDISIEYVDNGVTTVKQLDKVILTRGAWTTIIFKYQDWVPKDDAYGPVKFSIRRFRKVNGAYSQQSKFNISNAEQARKIIEALEAWMAEK